jgi:hypothetical protein
MRTLIVAVLVVGVLVGLVSIPARVIWRWREFHTAGDEGDAIIERFKAKRPDRYTPARWENAVVVVYNAWGNVAFSPDYIGNQPLRPWVEELQAIEQRATRENAEEQLRSVFDMLERLRPRSKRYIDGMRMMFDDCLKPREVSPPATAP